MGRFQRSERGGGQPDPQEALRRARDAVARERAERRGSSDDDEEKFEGVEADELERVEQALREHDERVARDEDRDRGG
jgi:hypothetical protein